MPISLLVKLKNFVLKCGPSQMPEGVYDVKYEDVEACHKLQLKASTTKEFLIACAAAGVIAVAVVGVSLYFLKELGIVASLIGFNCVIFQVSIPAEKEDEFDRYVANELREELNRLFSDVENHLRKEMGDDVDSVPKDVMEALKATKISSVAICGDDEAERAKKAVKRAAEKELPPPPPKKPRIKENPQAPTTSLLVFYEPAENGVVDKYVVTAKILDGTTTTEPKEEETDEEYALVRHLQPGQSYLIWVQSVRNGIRSKKSLLKDPVRTARYDPLPWREWTSDAILSKEQGVILEYPKAISGQKELAAPAADQALWKSDLHVELRKILGIRFPDLQMKDLLSKCDELGIVEAKDLKYLDSKEITDQLKETIKPVEILKLMDYAKDQYTTSYGTSEEEKSKRGSVYNISIEQCENPTIGVR